MTTETQFQHPLASLTLKRWPRRRHELLRAWDGADMLLLDACVERAPGSQVLVVNDGCGALALSLHVAGHAVTSSGDSWLAWRAMTRNAEDNHIDPAGVAWRWPQHAADGQATTVLLRVPKSLALFEYQLSRLHQDAQPGAEVLVGAMDKHAPPGLQSLLERYLDQVTRDDGRRKAHVWRGRVRVVSGSEALRDTVVDVPELGMALHNAPGVFSQHQLDPGARLLLQHIPSGITGPIADLGCGNGVIGLRAAQRNPSAQVWFCDESAQAIASARHNAEQAGVLARCHFHHGNGLDGLQERFDLVLLNPPFHRGHAVDTGVAEMLFDHARRHLGEGATLRVIGNRHLPYAQSLRRRFGQVEQIATNSKFTVWQAGSSQ